MKNIENELYAYIATLCKDFESYALQIGGTDNHIHILCRLSRKIALMKLVQEIKATFLKMDQNKRQEI
ncbi:transposase [Chryseobacterium sp. Marseille-Q3244]|uniref:transposase n=1 Tax=Chryseobacterium sp. Marseille-Q3244 TaxID=2758092 RepID=UPI0024E12FA0|nr:transposase [Chryseobacterium sp. Marseille-Q3244]